MTPRWLTLSEAADLAGVTDRTLRKRVQRGTLHARRVSRRGRLVALVDAAELAQEYPAARAAGGRDAPPAGDPAAAELARLHAELEAASKVEAGLQRYADRLELALDTERADRRRELAAVSRALGQAEERATRYLELARPRRWWHRRAPRAEAR